MKTDTKSKHLFLRVVAVFFVFPAFQAFAGPPITFEVLATFDYPGFPQTWAFKINDDGYVAGPIFNVAINTLQGYLRSPAGHFSPPIVDPNGYPYWTGVYGLNNLRQMCGSYNGGPEPGDAFLLSHHHFVRVDYPGALYNDNLGLNDAGNYCGDHSIGGNYSAFVNIDGTYISFEVPGSMFTGAYAINNLNQCVGYYYFDGVGEVTHGFFRDADGTMTYPIDAPADGGTSLYGMNDRGWVVGSAYENGVGNHAALFLPGSARVSYDYPGADYTEFYGINNKGQICGAFGNNAETHGLVVRVKEVAGN